MNRKHFLKNAVSILFFSAATGMLASGNSPAAETKTLQPGQKIEIPADADGPRQPSCSILTGASSKATRRTRRLRRSTIASGGFSICRMTGALRICPRQPTVQPNPRCLSRRGNGFSEKEMIQDWKTAAVDAAQWETVTLPATWEQHSNYTNDNVYGWFRRNIIVPDS